jgi:hypothetical protein
MDCTKPQAAKFESMDVEGGAQPGGGIGLHTPKRAAASSRQLLALASAALVLSVIALGLGVAANVRAGGNQATIRSLSRDNGVILVDSIRKSDGEYRNAGNLFAGTGYWARMRDMLYQRSDLRVRCPGQEPRQEPLPGPLQGPLQGPRRAARCSAAPHCLSCRRSRLLPHLACLATHPHARKPSMHGLGP